jgi:hypothetical protein
VTGKTTGPDSLGPEGEWSEPAGWPPISKQEPPQPVSLPTPPRPQPALREEHRPRAWQSGGSRRVSNSAAQDAAGLVHPITIEFLPASAATPGSEQTAPGTNICFRGNRSHAPSPCLVAKRTRPGSASCRNRAWSWASSVNYSGNRQFSVCDRGHKPTKNVTFRCCGALAARLAAPLSPYRPRRLRETPTLKPLRLPVRLPDR